MKKAAKSTKRKPKGIRADGWREFAEIRRIANKAVQMAIEDNRRYGIAAPQPVR